MAGAFHGNEGESISIILLVSPDTYLFDQMVQAQQTRDQQILGLVKAMENTYSFVVSADGLKSHPVLQDIVEQILKQTIECGYFIQEYTRRNFGGTRQVLLNEMAAGTEDRAESVIVYPFIDIDDQIAKFCTAFTDLRKDFDSKLSLSTALVMSRMASTVDMIGACLYTFRHFILSQFSPST